tara:strand:- start:165 stop:1082 length:918 start_codon:yes stop_codon:yes gene_type:complete
MQQESPQISIQINNYVDSLNYTIQHPNQIFSPNNLSSNNLSPNNLSPNNLSHNNLSPNNLSHNNLSPDNILQDNMSYINHNIYPPSSNISSTDYNTYEISPNTSQIPSPEHNKLSTTYIETDTSTSTSSSSKKISTDDENDICSICLETIDLEQDNSINSCNCKNKLHIDCLIKWIEYKDDIYCEICQTQYNIPHEVLLNYYNQTIQSSSLEQSNDYYINSYNNSNNQNNNNQDNPDNQDNLDSDISDDNYENENEPRNMARERRLYNELLFLQRRRQWYITLLCSLFCMFIAAVLIIIYEYVYM